jgi:hypothetical protein
MEDDGTMDKSENLLTIKEAADRLGKTEEEILKKIGTGSLSAVEKDGEYFVPESEIKRIGLENLGECIT